MDCLHTQKKTNLQFIFYHPTDFCRLKQDEGQGTSFTFATYYDVTTDRCNPFLYKGQGGNANRFENERECIRNCSTNVESTYPFEGEMILWTYSETRFSFNFYLI